jgi:DNA polymerase III subunit gamma/tau
MESLAVAHRPRTFDDLVGQKHVQVILRQMIMLNKVPSALLFDGTKGTGKTTTLRILAAALNCEGSPVPCGQCVSCKAVFTGTSLDLTEVDAASHGLVDDIRALNQRVLYATGGNWHVVGLDEAHGVSKAGADALLKTFEETPPNVVFVLLTTEPHKIPDTLISRCTRFTFRRIGVADIAGRLAQIRDVEQLTAEPALLHHIAERADGSMRNAIMSFDQVTRVGISTVADYVALLGDDDHGLALVEAMTSGDPAAAFAQLDTQLQRTGDHAAIAAQLVGVLRDILVLQSGGTTTKQGPARAVRAQLAATLDTAAVVKAMTVLWDLKTKTRSSDQSALTLAVALITEIFAKLAAPAAKPAPARLTLAEMAAAR